MATTSLGGTPVETSGDLPTVGAPAPAFVLCGTDLSDMTSNFIGTRTVLNIFPSIDTGVCATSVRKFNELAAGLDNTNVICVSNDLPRHLHVVKVVKLSHEVPTLASPRGEQRVTVRMHVLQR